jgi:nucleotide-binding universal stress UspA family protein
MGSRGSGGFAGGLGSVARAVLRGTAGPLLIVHADADRDREPEDAER